MRFERALSVNKPTNVSSSEIERWPSLPVRLMFDIVIIVYHKHWRMRLQHFRGNAFQRMELEKWTVLGIEVDRNGVCPLGVSEIIEG